VGLATDHCVLATALDAVRAGYETTVLLDLTAGVLPQTTDSALRDMQAAGVRLLGAPHAGH
jgi:nicotinamidase/pyrazinamidase